MQNFGSVLGLFLVLFFAAETIPLPAFASQPTVPLATSPSRAGLFEFRSGLWINLHHFLYAQALPSVKHHPLRMDLSPDDRKTWSHAVEYYRQHMISRDLLFDSTMRRIDSYLAGNESKESSKSGEIEGDLSVVLNAAAPIYKRYWWPQHDEANRFWIMIVRPMVESLGSDIHLQMASAYNADWPTKQIRVDLVSYANWAGAYTSTDASRQVHIIVSSEDPGNQGFAALEVLFHEASHGIVDGTTGKLGEAIQTQARLHNIPIPRELWHAIIFYTSGELIRRDLDNLGVRNYEPYADKHEIWRGPWRDYHSVLSLFWSTHLDGNLSLDEAIAHIMSTLVAAKVKSAVH